MPTTLPTVEQAIYSFWSQFGYPAYEENAVFALSERAGDNKNVPEFPYITYELKTGAYSGTPLSLSASAWFGSPSWDEANALVEAVKAQIPGQNRNVVAVQGGYIAITQTASFVSRSGDSSDSMIKRVIFNYAVSFLSKD